MTNTNLIETAKAVLATQDCVNTFVTVSVGVPQLVALEQAVEECAQETRSIVALIDEIENLSLPPVSKEKLKFITDKYKD